MRRILIYLIILAAALLIPEQGNDVGKLQPVELILLYKEDAEVVLETDTEDIGRGATVEEALYNLKETTTGVVFLDTADYLLIADGAEELLPDLAEYVKPSIGLCYGDVGIDLAGAAAYLVVHPPETTLKTMETGTELPQLQQQNNTGKFILKISNTLLTKS